MSVGKIFRARVKMSDAKVLFRHEVAQDRIGIRVTMPGKLHERQCK